MGAGAGSVQDMIVRLKNNNALLKGSKVLGWSFDKKASRYSEFKSRLSDPGAKNPEELERIKAGIRREARARELRILRNFGICLLIVAITVFWLNT